MKTYITKYILLIPIFLSSELLFATYTASTTIADHTGSSGHGQSATD